MLRQSGAAISTTYGIQPVETKNFEEIVTAG